MTLCRRALIAALAAPLAAPLTAPLPGQSTGHAPYAPIVLLLPSGPRTLALGNTGIVGRDDDALFFNPAQLAIARGFSASGERYSANAGGGAVAAVTRFHGGGIAVGARMADYEGPANAFPSDRRSMLDPGPTAGTSLELSAGLAQVIKGYRVGGAAKYVEDAVSAERVGRVAFDVGVAKDFMGSYSAGLSVQQIGESMNIPCSITTGPPCTPPAGAGAVQRTRVDLPLRTTVGIGTQRGVGAFDLLATAAVSVLRDGFVTPSGGAELGYSWLDGYSIALRAGGRRPLTGESALTAGAGFTMDRLSIDYALETLSGSRLGHRFGLRIR